MDNAAVPNATHNITDNGTAREEPLIATWTLAPIVALLTFVFGSLANGCLLLLFIKDSSLHTPFNMYLINLLVANLGCLMIQYPLEFFSNLYGTWFMSDGACTAYIYGYFVMQAAIKNAHLLIALNRIWAVAHPISYRLRHSVRTAILLCLAMWVYVHLALVQGWVADALYYRLEPRKFGCFLNAPAQPIMNKVTVLLVYDLPLVVMILAFPLIQVARMVGRKVLGRNMVVPNGDTVPVAVTNVVSMSAVGRGTRRNSPHTQPVRRLKSKSNGYLLLAFLTVSAVICWAPINIYYILVIYVELTPSNAFYQVATILFSCQCVLDPILFTMALSGIKNSLRRTFSFCKK